MAALRLGDSPKGKDPVLPSLPDAVHNISLKGKTSLSVPSVPSVPSQPQEQQTIKVHDMDASKLGNTPTYPSLRIKQSDVEKSTNEDQKDLEFLDNLLDSESATKKPTTNVEHSEKRDLDDEEWLDEFLGD